MKRKGLCAVNRRHFIACGAALVASPLLGLASAQAQSPAAAAATASPARRIVVLGDSLSSEYGLARGSGWVALLQQRLAQQQPDWQLVNASIGGDTTSGGRSRLPALLRQQKPAVLVIELGSNDALRGLPLSMTEANLDAMIKAGQQAGAKVLLVGNQVPPNYGQRYTQDFAALFPALASANHTALVPFMLKGVADTPDAEQNFQADRLHPLASAHPRILDNIWPALERLLRPS